jgi:hypothetical protein
MGNFPLPLTVDIPSCGMTSVAPKYPSLDRADAFRIMVNLECALEVFNRNEQKRPLTTMELYLRSMISTLRREMIEHTSTE